MTGQGSIETGPIHGYDRATGRSFTPAVAGGPLLGDKVRSAIATAARLTDALYRETMLTSGAMSNRIEGFSGRRAGDAPPRRGGSPRQSSFCLTTESKTLIDAATTKVRRERAGAL